MDGFVADGNDQPRPLFDWLTSGDVPLDESGDVKVPQVSYDYIRPYWDQMVGSVDVQHLLETRTWCSKATGCLRR